MLARVLDRRLDGRLALAMANSTAPDPKAALDALAAYLTSRTAGFCEQHLDAVYAALCRKLIAKLRRKRVVPFATGRPEIWAASVVHALAQINFALDKTATPHTTADAIADFFGASKVTIGLKAKAIRDLLKLQHWDREFSTAAIAASNPYASMGMVNGLIVTLPIGGVEATGDAQDRTGGAAGRRSTSQQPQLEVHLSEAEYAVLSHIDEVAVEEVTKTVRRTPDGVVLRLSRAALDDLVGYVAGEANHERSRRRAEVLHAIADEMEAVLARGR